MTDSVFIEVRVTPSMLSGALRNLSDRALKSWAGNIMTEIACVLDAEKCALIVNEMRDTLHEIQRIAEADHE